MSSICLIVSVSCTNINQETSRDCGYYSASERAWVSPRGRHDALQSMQPTYGYPFVWRASKRPAPSLLPTLLMPSVCTILSYTTLLRPARSCLGMNGGSASLARPPHVPVSSPRIVLALLVMCYPASPVILAVCCKQGKSLRPLSVVLLYDLNSWYALYQCVLSLYVVRVML